MLINKFYPSPNFTVISRKIKYLIIHYTEMPFKAALQRLCDPAYQVSCHYLIKQNGEIYQLVEDVNVAWHAGVSAFNQDSSLNHHSIGIELDNSGKEEFTENLLISLVNLCHKLKVQYDILPQNILGHSDIAPSRKIDPGIFFDWSYLLKFDLGILFEPTTGLIINVTYQFGDANENISHLQKKLAIMGYKIQTTGIFDQQTNAVIRAFQLHFSPSSIGNINIFDLSVHYSWDAFSEAALNSIFLSNEYLPKS